MPDRSTYPAKDDVRVANPDANGIVGFAPSDPFADIIRDSGTPVTGIEPPIKDLDGDTVLYVDSWIEYIAAADDPANDQVLGEADPDARPSWLVPGELSQLIDTLGITQGLVWYGDTLNKVDTTQFHTNLAWYAIAVKISDGTNIVQGFFRLYPTGSVPTLAVPNFYIWDANTSAENVDLNAWTKADGTDLGEIHSNLTGATYSIKHVGCMQCMRLSTPQRLWFVVVAFTTNKSYLWSMKTDGSDPIEHVEVTDGNGTVSKAMAIDEALGIVFMGRAHGVIQKVTIAAPSGFVNMTNADAQMQGESALAVDGARVYYGTDIAPGISVRSLLYDDTDDQELASSAALIAQGIDTTGVQATIWGMAYNAQNMKLYCVQENGVLFSVHTGTGVVAKLMDAADWDVLGGASAQDFRYLELDEQNQALWAIQSVSNTTTRNAWKIPIDNEAAGNTEEFEFASSAAVNRWFTGCLGPIFIISI